MELAELLRIMLIMTVGHLRPSRNPSIDEGLVVPWSQRWRIKDPEEELRGLWVILF